jgi:hypothetical protein
MKLVRGQKVVYDEAGNMIDTKPIMLRYAKHRWFIDTNDYLWFDEDEVMEEEQAAYVNIPITGMPVFWYHRNT